MKTFSNFFILSFVLMLFACSESTSLPEATQTTLESPPAEADNKKRPNIIFILADDMGWGDVGYNGSDIATPNLDQLAADGVRLNRNYVYPVCSPTRAALLTGHSPLEYGLDGPMSDTASLPVDVKLMPEYFKELGYQTHMVGKWHLGIGDPAYFPIARGFDTHYGFLGGWVDYYTHVYSGGLDWQRDGVSVREKGHATELMTAEALRLIASKNDSDNPFFLYLSYNAPHTPLQSDPVTSGLNASVVPEERFVYAELVTGMDAGIGQVLEALEADDQLDNTLVIFSSDNGGALRSGASNGNLRGGKGDGAVEGGIRVPGLVWWKGQIEGGGGLEQPIVVHDWLPTLLEALGEDPAMVSDAYGQSMWPALISGDQVERKPTTVGVAGSFMALDWPWKLLDNTTRGPDGVRTVALYNLEEDPGESTDLAEQQAEKFAELSAIIATIPDVASIRSSGPPPDDQFLNEDGSWNFDFRIEESRAPWADGVKKAEN